MTREEVEQRVQQFIAAFQTGDQQAFSEFMALCNTLVMRIVYRFFTSYHDIQEVVSEIWIKVACHLNQYDRRQPFIPWLLTITYRTCIDFLRQRCRSILLIDRLDAFTGWHGWVRSAEAEVIRSHIPFVSMLPAHRRSHIFEEYVRVSMWAQWTADGVPLPCLRC